VKEISFVNMARIAAVTEITYPIFRDAAASEDLDFT
jgi:hypothetical protein